MKDAKLIVLLNFIACLTNGADNTPRGVGPEFAKFFNPSSKSFSCITKPSITLPYSRVNDDYCDCPDGSDEPGTSACSYLSPLSPQLPSLSSQQQHPEANTTIALPGFYCANKGHNPTYIPFNYVNDGICDYELCCDGSDEYLQSGGVKCPDKCADIGKEWRKHNEARQKSLDAATAKRRELVSAAAKKRIEIQDQIKALVTAIEAAELKVKQLGKEKEEVERKEKNRVVKGTTSSGKAGILAGLAKSRIEQLTQALSTVRDQRNSYLARIETLEEILKKFKEEYNPNFNDEGVKRAVRAWEDHVAGQGETEFDEYTQEERDIVEMTKGEHGIEWEEYESGDVADDVESLYSLTAYLPTSLQDWLNTKLTDLRSLLVANGILAASSTSSDDIPESKALKDARNRHDSAVRELEDSKRKKTENEEDLTRDYGQDDVFRTLSHTCISTDSGEYTYELCFLDKVSQKSKKGSGHQNMGNFVSWDKMFVDEEEWTSDGRRGLGKGERVVMKFEGGSHCWNGPSRSTTVVMACSENDEIWRVSEEEKCVYRMEVGTAAVCEAVLGDGNAPGEEGVVGGSAGNVKDEL